MEDRVSFEEAFYELTAKLRCVIANYNRSFSGDQVRISTPIASPVEVINSANSVRLPKLDLPKFTGKYEEWFPFYEMFNSIIDNNRTINSLQKFQYLRASVTGEAANVIRSLELSEQNYSVAWNSLKQRYDNKRAIVHTHLRALFELPSIAKENAELRRVADTVVKHVQALNALRYPTEHWDEMLIYLISSKFDPITTREWHASLSGTELPTYRQFVDFLERRCQLLESVIKSAVAQIAGMRLVAHAAVAASTCGYCHGEHPIYYCREFIKLSVPQRLAEIRKRKLYANCLRGTNHAVRNCNSGSCKKCGDKHNSLLHFPSKANDIPEKTKTGHASARDRPDETTVMTHSSISYNAGVLLSTAVVYIVDASGTKQPCRVLLDSGSQANFITRSYVKRLRLKSNPSNIKITGINGITSSASEVTIVKLHSRLNGFAAVIECILTDRITERLPASPIDREKICIPPAIKLADPDFHRRSDIDVLIGVELFGQLVCVGQLKSSQAHPTLHKTHFGWILAGRFGSETRKARRREVGAFCVSIDDVELQNQLAKFWQLEESCRPRDSYSSMERFCERHFRDNTTRDGRGRVMVTLPIREDKIRELGDTRDIALRRFYALERRLDRDPTLKSQYKEFIHEYLSLGHMKWIDSADDDNDDLLACYLPHHCVLKPSNETTKLRVVFDASCESSTGVSLNDALMVGSTAQQDLFSIILRFRTLGFVFSADIVKMYRQILINPKQTKLQRIFWRDHAAMVLRIGELLTVTYGTAAAAHLAIKTLEYLAETYMKQFPVGAEHIMRDFYVDDILSGADTLEEALRIKGEVVEILSRGTFQLSKWSSNHADLLSDDQNKHNAEVQIDKESTSRVLGVVWNPSTDTFRFAIEMPASAIKITKRIILSEIARLFDPLGLLGSVIILPKILLQEIWQLKLQWDESIPLELHTRWSAFREQLNDLNELRIPRFIKDGGEHSRFQIHGFCDASQRAYGACLYIRRQIGEDEFRVDLWCSKTRVAPLKMISISRLELCAALLLAQLWDKARSSIKIAEGQSFLWSDATIALQWISSCSRKCSVFVANRVGEIQRLTRASDWRHVPSAQNPADLLSRGVHPHEIRGSALWWHGPEFLKGSEAAWPSSNPHIPESEMPEMRRTVAVIVCAATTSPFVELVHKFSSLNKLCRIVAYCLRFLKPRLYPPRERGTHSHEKISAALDCLCKDVQKDAFINEVEQLKKGGSLASSSSLTLLAPLLDERGLIRVGGRLKNSELSYGARHPVLLPKNHRLTHLIIEREHRRNLHAGLQGTMAAVRQNFWPLSARSVTRKIIRQCIACFRCRPATSEAKMGLLPRPRVTPSRPFLNCGVDYAGPLIVREGKRRNARNNKAYVCVFVCLATKAIHLEVVSDLTTEAFLAAFKRFISRRGSPASMYSDNGTNFKGASRQLSELYEFQRADENQNKIK